MKDKNIRRKRLKKKIRAKINGTDKCPRLSVFRSNKFIYIQAINDLGGKTLAEASDLKIVNNTKAERAKQVGKIIAQKLLDKKIEKVIFDRNGFQYTGRIKALAESARSSGLKF